MNVLREMLSLPLWSPEDETGTASGTTQTQEAEAGKGEEAADGKPAEQEAAGKTEEEAAGAEGKDKPDEGGDKPVPLTAEDVPVPEGWEVNEELRTEFLEFANGEGLSKEQVQGLVAIQEKAMNAASEKASALWLETQEKWQEEIKADKEFGGEKLESHLASIAKVLDHYGDDQTRHALDLTGAGNHPAIIKFLAKVSADLSEGKPTSGKPVDSGSRDPARTMFPEMG